MNGPAWRPIALAIVAIFASQANAQDTTPPPAPSQAPLPAPLPAPPQAPLPAPGQPPGQAAGQSADGEPRRPWTFTPFVSLTETYSDNVAAVADALARSGWITDLTPGLRVEADSNRVRGFLEYRLHELRYSTDSALDTRQNFLLSRFTVDAIENFAFVDARADITQESRSPFGAAPAADVPSASANRVETTTLQVSPWIRGQVGDYANYLLRARAGEVRTDDGTIPDTRSTEWSGRLASASGGTRFGWSLEGSFANARNDAIGSLDDSRLRARLYWTATPSLRLALSGGVDETDFAGPPTRREQTPGAGFTWIPSERLQLGALYERRVFGDGYSASAAYRASRTAFIFTSTRDAAILPGLTATETRASLADVLALMLAGGNPDPQARAAEARRRLDDASLSAAPVLGSSLLSSRPVVYKQTDAAVLFEGARNTLALRYAYFEQREYGAALDGSPAPAGAQDLRRQSADASWSYRFTPATTGTLVATHQRTNGLTEGTPDTRQSYVTAAIATDLGPRTTASAGVRRMRFDSTAPEASYTENAVFAQISIRF
ncbi:MAG: TIGR03016 family PEP-CTERM system-associated outer membrane protein [Betaproteobacteria bacterium]|nr:TIGR03016 family PEP-CTERM system-associated outer membrane protein [Betaproteobacteria bacterium]